MNIPYISYIIKGFCIIMPILLSIYLIRKYNKKLLNNLVLSLYFRKSRLIEEYVTFTLEKDKMSNNEIYLKAKEIKEDIEEHNSHTIEDCPKLEINKDILSKLEVIIKETEGK